MLRAGAVVFAASKGWQASLAAKASRGLVLRGATRGAEAREGHGLFTGALLDALASRESDHDGDGALQLSELVDEVRGRVVRTSSGMQVPWVVRREIFGDFVVARPPP